MPPGAPFFTLKNSPKFSKTGLKFPKSGRNSHFCIARLRCTAWLWFIFCASGQKKSATHGGWRVSVSYSVYASGVSSSSVSPSITRSPSFSTVTSGSPTMDMSTDATVAATATPSAMTQSISPMATPFTPTKPSRASANVLAARMPAAFAQLIQYFLLIMIISPLRKEGRCVRPVSDVVVLRFAEMALAALLKNRDTALLFVNLRLKACDLRAVLLQLVVNHLDHGTRLVHGFPDVAQFVADSLLPLSLLAQHVDVRLAAATRACHRNDSRYEQGADGDKLVKVDGKNHIPSPLLSPC